MALAKVYRSFHGEREYQELPVPCLGSGNFAEVKSARTISTGAPVAIKVIIFGHTHDVIVREYNLLAALGNAGGHPNVIELVDAAYEINDLQKRLVLVLPKCDTVISRWIALGHRKATILVRTELTRQMYAGLEFLHLCSLFHRDLHQGNILVHGQSGQIKIADFGASCIGSPKVEDAELRQDLWAITRQACLSVWDGKENIEYLKNPAARKFCVQKGVPNELIEKAEGIIKSRPRHLCRDLTEYPLKTWDEVLIDSPGIAMAIQQIMVWKWNHPPPRIGIPVPENLHHAFLLGSLIGPRHMLTASVVLGLVSQAIAKSGQEQAQDIIRQITLDMH
ncbi:calcium-dependent protein kinase 4-like [Sycon ciliatum]|uniref:calcium-dependent protein kinase 4-like n=1 Tax=Sycon ciliatum TaxID=27933 RepID=UPI0031F65401